MIARDSELPKLDETQSTIADAMVFDQVTLHPGDELSLEPITDVISREDLPRIVAAAAGRSSPSGLRNSVGSPLRVRNSQRKRRTFLRVAVAGLVLGLVGGTIFVLLGGVGALMVAGGAVAGLFLYTAPVLDPQLPSAAPSADQGKSDAELVVMPDPGFRPQDPKPTPKLPTHLP